MNEDNIAAPIRSRGAVAADVGMSAVDDATAEPGTTLPAVAPSDPVLERFWATLRRLPRYLALAVNLARDGRVPAGAKGAVLLGGAYAVSPLDLVPGIIPVAGQLDDVVVLLLTLRRAVRACPAPLAAEHLGRVGLSEADFATDLAACRATARWLAVQGLRLGGRVAVGAGRRLRSVVRGRSLAGGD